MDRAEDISLREKLRALLRIAAFRPLLMVAVALLSLLAAILEGIGLGFIVPILATTRGGGEVGGIAELFLGVYETLGVPFTIEYIVLGAGAVMTVRYASRFLVRWLRGVLEVTYTRSLQSRSFQNALDARIAYFDERGSDEILNAIVTQASAAGSAITNLVQIVEHGCLSAMYLVVALLLAPKLTVVTVVVLGGFLVGFRSILESGYSVGNRIADANERLQEAVQAGTQGLRDVRLFGLESELYADFERAAGQFVDANTSLRRNEAALNSSYQLVAALTVFALVYLALEFTAMSLPELGVFLFAMFRLAPRVSNLNDILYNLDGTLPHVVRTHRFVDELEERREPTGGQRPVPTPIDEVAFEDVSFGYDRSEQVLEDVSLAIGREEFVAVVGPSGAGKSTLLSLLARFYEPDDGEVTADGVCIAEFPLRKWRDRMAVVRQNPFVFNDTLRYNLTIGAREVTDADLERACEIAQVSEFLEDLPDGFDTVLGDDGVRLSGGQRQRVAIARALLTDADLLVFDEATSDLDTELEAAVHGAIEEMDRDYAMLVIAHRLSTIVGADRIYVLEDGQVVESGAHEALLDGDSRYAELYAGAV